MSPKRRKKAAATAKGPKPTKPSVWQRLKPTALGTFRSKILRKVLAYSLIGSMAIGAGKFARVEIERRSAERPKWELYLGFGDHETKASAANVLRFIDTMSGHGSPVKAFFYESPITPGAEYVSEIMSVNKEFEGMRQQYDYLTKTTGMPREKAVEKVMEDLRKRHPLYKDFHAELDTGLALRGIRAIPVETEIASRRNFELRLEEHDAESSRLYSGFASIKEMAKVESELLKHMIGYTSERNRQIKGMIGPRLDIAEKIFPGIRGGVVAGFLGKAHEGLYADFDPLSSPKVYIGKMPSAQSYSITEFMFHRTMGTRLPSEREAQLIALGNNYFDPFVPELLKSKGQPFVMKAFRNAISATQGELDRINSATAGVKDHAKRAEMIVAYFGNK